MVGHPVNIWPALFGAQGKEKQRTELDIKEDTCHMGAHAEY